MLLGINIDKVRAERFTEKPQDVTVKNSVRIVDVQESKFQFSKDKIALKFSFVFTVNYEPKLAVIELNGTVSYLAEEGSDIIKEFRKAKRVKSDKVSAQIMNAILNKCNIKALTLAQDINLPSPIDLPKVKMKSATTAASYIG